MKLLGKGVASQSFIIAFNTAFNAVAQLFIAAALLPIAAKIIFSRRAKSHSQETLEIVELMPRLPTKRSSEE